MWKRVCANRTHTQKFLFKLQNKTLLSGAFTVRKLEFDQKISICKVSTSLNAFYDVLIFQHVQLHQTYPPCLLNRYDKHKSCFMGRKIPVLLRPVAWMDQYITNTSGLPIIFYCDLTGWMLSGLSWLKEFIQAQHKNLFTRTKMHLLYMFYLRSYTPVF